MKRWVYIVLLFTGCDHYGFPFLCNDTSWQTAIKNDIIAQGRKGEIHSMIYKGEIVYQINACLQCNDFSTDTYNCGGKVICTSGGFGGGSTCPRDMNKSIDRKLIWSN